MTEGIAVETHEPLAGTALADLYRAHAVTARRVAFLLTGDAHMADDLVQDAFVRLSGRLLRFRDPEAAGAYIRRTVTSLAIAGFRRRDAERRRNQRHAAGSTDLHLDPDIGERDRIWRALQTLPDRQRAAITLRYYLGLADEQIGDALRCRPGTVKSLLSRGMSSLRGVVDDE